MEEFAFLDGKFRDLEECPQSDDYRCTKCGGELMSHYGFAGGYGLGGCELCVDCGEVHNFQEDVDK